MVWNAASQLAVHKFCEHTAAVKALAWSPHQTGESRGIAAHLG